MTRKRELVQLIYCSAASVAFSRNEMIELLSKARRKNAGFGLTGILLYSEGAFFQVLEGEPQNVDAVFRTISQDERHARVTVIIRETIAGRAFDDWTMGFAELTADEGDAILGANDFFGAGNTFSQLGPGRAKKLLAAFSQGRWRSRLDETRPASPVLRRPAPAKAEPEPKRSPVSSGLYSYAFQPIVDASTDSIFSHEALIRGRNRESAFEVLQGVPAPELHAFDESSRVFAIEMAASLGLPASLNLNFLPLSVESSATAISSILDAADRCGIRADRIVLEVLEREFITDFERFRARIDTHRGSGLLFAIDDFGSGHAGLNLLADFQPDIIKLDMHLVRDIDRRGPRQAIIHGILRTCLDLGIDVIAEGIETSGEYEWLRGQGVHLFQGYLFAKPAFERLEQSFERPPGFGAASPRG